MRFIVATCVLLSLGFAAAAPCALDQDCVVAGSGFSGLCINGACACAHEFYGLDCECDLPSENIESDNPVEIVEAASGFSSFDHIQLTVDVSKKYYNVHHSFVDNDVLVCQHLLWQEHTSAPGTNNCKDSYSVDAEWADLRDNCGFDLVEETAQWRIFEGVVATQVEETLDSARGTDYFRTITYDQRVQVWLPTRVSVATNLLVFSDANVYARLVEQYTSNDASPHEGYFIFSTNLNSPYKLVNPRIDPSAISDVSIQETLAGEPVPDCDGVGPACLQNFWVDMSLRVGCFFDDTYSTYFEIACSDPVANDCPLQGQLVRIDIEIEGSDACSQVIAIANIRGSIQAYDNAALTRVTQTLVAGAPVYFDIATWSDQVSVTSTQITRIEVRDTWAHPGFYVLYDVGVTAPITVAGGQASLDVRNSGNAGFNGVTVARDHAEFMYITDHIYPGTTWNSDDWTTQVITVDLYVILGHVKKHMQKTFLLAQDDDNTSTSISIEITAEDVDVSTGSQPITAQAGDSGSSSSNAAAPPTDSSASTTTPAICAASMFVALAMLA